jgi:uncharacterized protein YdeI (BOF family)
MKKLLYLFVIVLLFSGCIAKHRGLTTDEKAVAERLTGQTYYTQANIWHVYTESKISSNNFHRGEVLSLGAKVNIEKCGDAEIKFTDNSGKIYILVLDRRNVIDLITLFNRYFSKENVMAEGGSFYKLTEQEQENIKKGIIDYGMCKEAVLMAYGYPTPFKEFTPDIKNNQWQYYLENNLRRTTVYFQDDKIVKIEDIRLGRKKPGRRRQKATVRENKRQIDALTQKSSNADELLKYKKLLDSGAITKDEYEQKKKQLLGL